MQSKKWTQGLLIIYLVMLTWIIVFKMQFSFASLDRFRALNLIPFQGSGMKSEVINNIIVFIPFGILIGTLWKEKSFIYQVVPLFLTSLAFELTQYILMVGATDITDIIMNTLGGVIGLITFQLFFKIFGTKAVKIINGLSLVAAILLSLLIGTLIVSNY